MIPLLLSLVAGAVGPRGPTCAGPVGDEDGHHLDAPRPKLSGPVQTRLVDGGAFRLHWTDEGADRVSAELLQWAEAELVEVRAHLESSDWQRLVGDDGTGGDAAIDAYFVSIDANGYANPVTPEDGAGGASCFVRFDPDIRSYNETVARSIVRHELMHCAQYRYTWDSHAWLYEASATYEQYRPAPDQVTLALLTNVLWGERIGEPNRRLDDVDGRFEYAGLMWFKFLEEDQGAPPWAVWEALEAEPEWAAGLDLAARDGVAEAFTRFSAFNQAACAGEDRSALGGYQAGNASCTASFEAPREVWDWPTLEIELLPAWTSVTYTFSRPADEAPGTVPHVSCTAGEGVLGVVLDTPEDGAVVWLDRVVAEGATPARSHLETPPEGEVLLVLAAASDLNVSGRCAVDWRLPPEEGGCACSSGPAGGGLPALALLGLLIVRRRRP